MSGVKITDTTLRDGHQSLWATRMRLDDMLPIVEKLDRVGYHSLEVWGGATFDVCQRYLNEDPWERLRMIKSYVKRTPLQMLLRGQSLVGYQHYPDDVVEAFVTRMVENGIDIIRIFDALNDIRNMKTAIKTGIKTGAHVQASVVYTVSPVHNTEHYLETAVRLVELGAHSICVKDMAGLLTPYQAYELISKLKEKTGLPVQLHSHYIGGLAVAAYLKAVEAGVDVIDTASVPLAFGASQPPVETVVRALQGTPYDTGLDMALLFEIAGYFEEVRKARGYERGVTRINDMRVFEHQVPGGMITNLVTQMEEQKSAHLLPQVLEEIPKVRRELGYPPLVTPTSQIVGTQAVLNVLLGERYKLVPGEVKAYFQGLYGKPPAPVDEAIARKVLAGKEPITCRPADLLEPRLHQAESELQGLAHSAEDVISYAIFPQITKKFLTERGQPGGTRGGTRGQVPCPSAGQTEPNEQLGHGTCPRVPVSTNQPKEVNDMDLAQIKELIQIINKTDIAEFSLDSDGVKLAIKKTGSAREGMSQEDNEVEASKSSPAAPAPPKAVAVAVAGAVAKKEPEPVETIVKAPMVGTFYRAPAPEAEPFVEVGARVEKGQTLCIIEAMKLMNEIESEVNGTVLKLLVDNAQAVEYGQPLMLIKED